MSASARPDRGRARPSPRIWWSNGVFFVGTHFAAALAVALRPPSTVSWVTLLLMVVLWQAASMGITVGYHRLYSHRAFRAAWPVRMFVALLGASAFQGSIKWWCLRHRLHHRFTDDPVHDPYAATKGLLWSHVGWIFYKSRYERLESVDQEDLETDPVVRLQHKYYIPLALITGFVFPFVVGALWGDPVGSFVYAGLVARLLIWHCTFLVNSLAHWDGLQPYSDDNTSKSNLVLALLTCGEGNHNFHHSFPHDFRSGPSPLDWDPSKWVIMLLHSLGLASGLRRARKEEIRAAREYMLRKKITNPHAHTHGMYVSGSEEDDDDWDGPVWTKAQLVEHARTKRRCMLLLDGFAVDATEYLAEHPGGAQILRRYAIGAESHGGSGQLGRRSEHELESEHARQNEDEDDTGTPEARRTGRPVRDADWAFHGGINKHSMAARRRVRQLRVARVKEE
ncbi:fatty acid desaturase-domain-containing protein [Trametes polyzona]|nr:fatty acid desaturase-domain-containing protein [Trametes polyzona]